MSPAECDVLNAGLAEVLRHLHDRLDAAFAAAYGWPTDLSVAAVVERVVALNRERAAEEAAGQVRWLRPTFQAPADAAVAARREQLALPTASAAVLDDWPKLAPDQFTTLHAALMRHGTAAPGDLARQFRGATRGKVAGILATLAALGQAREAGPGRYAA